MSDAAKSFDILATRASYIIIFDDFNKIIFRSVAKFLDS